MSRLDSFIRRMSAQRDCLNWAAEELKGAPGAILELGLGNGRTYDHLRSLFDAEDIYVFDRHVKAHPDCVPDHAHMIIGDFLSTLPKTAEKMTGKAKLAHCDIGSGDKSASLSLSDRIYPHLEPLLQPGALIISDQPFDGEAFEELPVPAGVPANRYYLYRKRI
ncbi:MAG: class I SAM-dependent methyltransferase [Sneathiellales bacterium]|nr:class I SAM-dependent methyltransferase [Sneathiellales bacterium]